MISKPTVLVLGAGASQPYGFPVGRELAETVCKEFVANGEPGKHFRNTPFSEVNRTGFIGGLFLREDGAHGTTQQVLPGVA